MNKKLLTLLILTLFLASNTLVVYGQVDSKQTFEVGISTDYWNMSVEDTAAKLKDLGVSFFSWQLDCTPPSYIWEQTKKVAKLAQLWPEGTIHILYNPRYGFDGEYPSQQADWWNNIERSMQESARYPAVKYVGLYNLEHYAGAQKYTDPNLRERLTQSQIESAYRKFNNMAKNYGLIPLHWGLTSYSKKESWNTESWFEKICGGKNNRFYAGGWPDQNAGWIWTKISPSDWQYEWVRKYNVESKKSKSPLALFTGMWRGETSRGTSRGAGWTYRNTNWWLTAI